MAGWQIHLAQAREALARGDLARAQASAEAALRADPPGPARAAALLVAGDAAAAREAYPAAARHYAEILARHPRSREAAPGTLGLAWAQYRQGDRRHAARTWAGFADAFPDDPRVPEALALSAETLSEAGELAAASRQLDRLLARHRTSAHADGARLTRVVVLMRRDREDEAVRDLEALVRTGGTSAIEARRRLRASLEASPSSAPAAQALPAAVAGHGHGLPDGAANGHVAVSAHGRPAANGNGHAAAGGNGHAGGNGDGHAGGNGSGHAAAIAVRHAGGSGAGHGPGDGLERFASAVVQSADRGAAPYLLHGLVVLGASRHGWTDPVVGDLAMRLLDGFPSYPPAPTLLARVGASAVTAGQWHTVRRAYEALIARDPAGPFARSVRVDLAEALVRTGAMAEARRHLDHAVAAGGRDVARALLLRAQVGETLGDRRQALADHDRLAAEHPRQPRPPRALLAHARLLEDAGQPARARPLLQQVVARGAADTAAEAAYRLARILDGAREHQGAAEWYLTAAYLGERSPWAGPALLGAGGALSALDETREALAIYRRLLEHPEVGGEAAYRAGELHRRAGRHEDALDLYLRATHLAPGSPAERRALVGAVRCLMTLGDRVSAEGLYRRLLDSGVAEPDLLADARQALQAGEPAR